MDAEMVSAALGAGVVPICQGVVKLFKGENNKKWVEIGVGRQRHTLAPVHKQELGARSTNIHREHAVLIGHRRLVTRASEVLLNAFRCRQEESLG